MQFSIPREHLIEALGHVIDSIGSGVILAGQPSLTNVHVLADDSSRIYFRATDRSLETRTEGVPGVVTQAGSALIPAKKLLEVTRLLPAETEVRVRTIDGQVEICANAGRFRLQSLPVDAFPDLMSADDPSVFEFDVEEGSLRHALSTVVHAVAKNVATTERAVLTGVAMEVRGGHLWCIATDGARLAMACAPAESDIPRQIVVPARTVGEMIDLLREGETSPVRLRIAGNVLRIELGAATMTSVLLDGAFPQYQTVIPREQPIKVTAGRDDLLAAIGRVGLVADGKQRHIHLELSSGGVLIQAGDKNANTGSELVEADVPDTDFRITLDYSVLTDALSALKGSQITLGFSTALQPCTIRSSESATTLMCVAPCRD